MRIAILVSSLAAVLALSGCASTPETTAAAPAPEAAAPQAPATSTLTSATANLAAASGSLVSGRLTLMPMDDGVHASGEIGGLKPNSTHAFHIHEKGDCSAADASSAGGHFNPTSQPHGRVTHPQHHAGDNDNLVANAEGVAKVDAHFPGVVLGGGGATDVVGKAIIVHADPDDYTTQPTGNAGARIACGVIQGG
jgi:Cu-Zn family superoxide dismutase